MVEHRSEIMSCLVHIKDTGDRTHWHYTLLGQQQSPPDCRAFITVWPLWSTARFHCIYTQIQDQTCVSHFDPMLEEEVVDAVVAQPFPGLKVLHLIHYKRPVGWVGKDTVSTH